MLVLSRKRQECVCIGNDVVVTVMDIRNKVVRIGIDAPKSVHVLRGELSYTVPAVASHVSKDKMSPIEDKTSPIKGRRSRQH